MLGLREVPAHTVPVPDTVSPQMQTIIGAPINPNWNIFPKSAEEWNARVKAAAANAVQALPALREYLHVKVEARKIDGVNAFMVTPEEIPPANRNRLLIGHADG